MPPTVHVHPPLFDLLIILHLGGSVNLLSFSRAIDTFNVWRYNYGMEKKKRTARRDSNYVIYVATHNGLAYIGLTRKGTVTIVKAVKERWRKHISRARHEDRDWEIYRYIKAGNWDGWTHDVITVIRGRAEAYAYERALVKELAPELNDQYM